MKQLKHNLLMLVVSMVLSAFTLTANAQEYSVDYKGQTIEQVIKDLRSRTGYEFVYQKQVVEKVPAISCSYKNLNLKELLNRIIVDAAKLDYEIVKKTVVIKKATTTKGQFFKKNVTGMVTDENGEPLVGAAIMNMGHSNGATTDVDGNFSILVEGKQPVLEISYVGYITKKVKINPNTPFVVVNLDPDATILDEVLVTGYQNIKRENATGSYQLISSKDLDKRHTATIMDNLEGQVPGLVAYSNGLNGKGESALTIRGTSSFEARTNPLVVVDGLPIEGSIETINPYNIANITVLKDAAAVAIYGARASNGVIVVTTKQASREKIEVDFNTDLTIHEKQDYSNMKWINAADLIELEQYNFNAMKKDADQTAFNSLVARSQSNYGALTPVMRMLLANHQGTLSDAEMNAQLGRLAKNDYRREWQDAYKRQEILQQYNLGLRSRGKYLSSNIELNYKANNMGTVNEYDRTLHFSYRGDLNATKWLNLSFGTNIISNRGKSHASTYFNGINAFQPYMSMYNADGTRAQMEGYILPDAEGIDNPAYGLKHVGFNLLDELDMNYAKSRNTNIRSFASATATILPGWTASAHFQYEDMYYKSNRHLENNSYYMRYLYNIYTMKSTEMVVDYDPDTWEEILVPVDVITHHIPDGGLLTTNTSEQAHYTFRAQTAYNNTFAKKHAVDVLAGFEFRETNTKTYQNILLGYDEQTQTNRNNLVNFQTLKDLSGSAGVLGPNYTAYGAPEGDSFRTSDILHRFYSIYFTGNYTYDRRYSASFSYRVDKTDLFGVDPEFRGRPLWSVGASWNIHNESWMKQYEWIDALKLRASYGLTGNIDSSVSSYLTATLNNEFVYGNLGATLDTPPNDQLRWEKTATFNIGADFSFFRNRLSGSIDYYNRYGSDLLTTTDLDPTTGWTQLTINNGKMTNKGIELQLNGQIIKPATRNDFGLSASFNIAYNKNEVTAVYHKPASGYTNLNAYTLHEGYPVHSLFSAVNGGIKYEDGIQYLGWKDKDGETHYSGISSNDFTIDDAVYSGSLDPKVVSSFVPQISYAGFTLSAMFSYYGGHVMRANVNDWSTTGSEFGYKGLEESGALSSSLLNYWRSGDNTAYLANGYLGNGKVVGYYSARNLDSNVVPADFLKIRNIVLGYDFPAKWCRSLGLGTITLRAQVNNLGTWARNKFGIDPEANSPISGTPIYKPMRSYTMSLHVNF